MIFIPTAGFESAIPAIEEPQTHALDRAATRIGHRLLLPRYKRFWPLCDKFLNGIQDNVEVRYVPSAMRVPYLGLHLISKTFLGIRTSVTVLFEPFCAQHFYQLLFPFLLILMHVTMDMIVLYWHKWELGMSAIAQVSVTYNFLTQKSTVIAAMS